MQWPKNTGEAMRKGMKHWLTYIYKGFSAKIEGAQARRRTYAGRGTRANKGQRWEQAGGGERERGNVRALPQPPWQITLLQRSLHHLIFLSPAPGRAEIDDLLSRASYLRRMGWLSRRFATCRPRRRRCCPDRSADLNYSREINAGIDHRESASCD